MKTLIVVFALVALSFAEEPKSAEPQEPTKQKRGLLEYEHAPALLPAPILAKSYGTPILHAGPVVTKVFEAPPAPFVRSYAEPYVTGPLITRGYGPHIYGAKTFLSAPILKAAPIYSAPILKAAPIYTAPIISKPILAPAPIFSYAPKLAAPITFGAYGHGW